MAYYWLTPPSRAVFVISVFLALLALLVRYAHVAIPVVSTYTFETLLTVACWKSLQRILGSGAVNPLHATIEEFAADGYSHIECFCPRCRMTRLRPIS